MKILTKISALLAAAALSASAAQLAVFAEGAPAATSDPAATAAPTTTPAPEKDEPALPALASGAFNSGYYHTKLHGDIAENDVVGITVVTHIPISDFVDGTTTADLDIDSIFGVAYNNDSFNPYNIISWTDTCSMWDSYVKVETHFMDVKYLGTGNEFNYSLCYNTADGNVTVPLSVRIAECVETKPGEKPEEDLSVPSYTLDSVTSNTIKAGTKGTVRVNLRHVGTGTISTVAAMLSSSDPDVIVQDISEKRSSSLSPSYSFNVSVPETAAAGVYNLSLNVTVFNKIGEAAGTYSYTIPVTVTTDVNNSALSVSSYKTSKSVIRPEDKFDLTITLKNNCGIDLSNIEVTLDGLDSSKFVLDGGFSKQTVSIKDGKTGKVTFPLVACKGISLERESIAVQAVYCIDPAKPQNTQSLDTSVILTCKPEGEKQELGKHDLTMTYYKVSSAAVAENTKFKLSITLENTSKTKIENARLSILGLDGTKFAIDSGLTYVDFSISAGKTKTFTFDILGCEGISSIREVIPILIEYGTVSAEVSATVPCAPKENKNEDGKVFAPNIIIESYDFGGDYVTAGDTFPLTVAIKNTSSEAVIENLKVTVNGASNSLDGGIAYSPANSSNSFFFETLGMKQSTELALDLLAKGDATPNSYPVEITFVYEYSTNGERYQASPVTETITIPLQQEDRLTVNEPEYPNYTVNVGEMCYISTSLVNKGKSGVYNVTASVEGEGFNIDTPSYYIGNINSGSEEYYDAQITPNTEGEIKGEIVITYEDANGTEKEQRAPFSFTAAQFNYDEMYGMEFDTPIGEFDGMEGEMPPEGGGINIIAILIGGAVVIAIVVIVVVVVIKKKRKKESEVDDEDI
ncbi:MAG: hypothetical protein IJ385_04810 [Ruminiclostridium sp.]|nr:hypothetical protein [Ruminiclostridium sp.]